MSKQVYDFSGYATKANLKCSDGRTIKQNAFLEQDGATVPLVWSHEHRELKNVLGHAVLENRHDGVYCYCSFNNNESGQAAKELVRHGDIASLSIFANKLKQNGSDVVHGVIKEVSLVMAGANPGALIENIVAHSEDGSAYINEEEAEIYSLEHQEFMLDVEVGEDEEEVVEEVKHEETTEDSDDNIEHKEKTVQDVIDTMNEEQKNVLYYMIGKVAGVEEDDTPDDSNQEAKHTNMEDNNVMKNAFELNTETGEKDYLSHDELNAMLKDAADHKVSSLKHAFKDAGVAAVNADTIAHADGNTQSYGIIDIDKFFPEVKNINNTPYIYKRRSEWVNIVLNGVHHTPFARVKSTWANVTADEARAKGYIKGAQKEEEVITAFKRTTNPTTIYKKQKLDRDDIVDITDFDVVVWLKSEMRVLLDEEIARAILIGDGRGSSDPDKIDPLCIRPILGDSDVYTIPKIMTKSSGDNESTFAKDLIRQLVRCRIEYRGSGTPDFFTTENMLVDMLLIEDTNGHRLYKDETEAAKAARVNKIVPVPVFNGVTRAGSGTDAEYNFNLLGILVNLQDYNVGADKGGNINMFDDFDIDFNQYKYLMETRISGALVNPYSAVSFEEKVEAVDAQG